MKLINDILKVKENYSLKRVAIAIILCFVIFLGSLIGICDFVLAKEASERTVTVFITMAGLLTSLLTINEVGKKFVDKEPKIEE